MTSEQLLKLGEDTQRIEDTAHVEYKANERTFSGRETSRCLVLLIAALRQQKESKAA